MSRADAKARTRQRLLERARLVFEAKGFNAATIEEIVEGAGYTRGAFYAHFKDKADIFWELAEQEDQAAFDEMAAEVDAASVDDKMTVVQAWFDRMMGGRPLSRAYGELLPQAGTTPEGRARMARLFAIDRAAGAKLLASTAEVLGVTIPIPIEHLAALALAVGTGLAHQHEVDPEAVPTALFADGLAYLWLGMMASVDVPEVSDRKR
jgi:AcrR family transcriptional regulator